MYGIYANIGDILMVNVTIYSIHGSYCHIVLTMIKSHQNLRFPKGDAPQKKPLFSGNSPSSPRKTHQNHRFCHGKLAQFYRLVVYLLGGSSHES